MNNKTPIMPVVSNIFEAGPISGAGPPLLRAESASRFLRVLRAGLVEATELMEAVAKEGMCLRVKNTFLEFDSTDTNEAPNSVGPLLSCDAVSPAPSYLPVL